MSKELTAIIVTAIAILGFLWNISTQIGSIQKQLGDVQGQHAKQAMLNVSDVGQ